MYRLHMSMNKEWAHSYTDLMPQTSLGNSVAGAMGKRQPYKILTVFMLNYYPAQFMLVETGTHSTIQLLSPRL